MPIRSLGVAETDVGLRRSHNEDAFWVDDELGLYAVADGMGGHAAGEVASRTALEVFCRSVEARSGELRTVRDWFSSGASLQASTGSFPLATPGVDAPPSAARDVARVVDLLEEAVSKANQEVWKLSRAEPNYAGMGCTLTAVAVMGPKAVMVHVGDSRVYLVRDRQLHQLSTDHTFVGELIRAGRVTAEQAKEHPLASSLLRAVGPQEAIQVDSLVFDVIPGDTLLLCSDGLHDYFDDLGWIGEAASATDVETVPGLLVGFANEKGGKDNVTAVLVRIEAHAGGQAEAVRYTTDVHLAIGAIRAAFLFEDLRLSQVARVLSRCEVVNAAAGEPVIRLGEELDRLMVVVSGCLAVDGAHGHVFGPQGHLGSDTLLRSRPARATVVAAQESRLLVLPRDAFSSLTRAEPRLGVALLERLGRRLADAERREVP